MSTSDEKSEHESTLGPTAGETDVDDDAAADAGDDGVYFFPEEPVSESRVRSILESGSDEEKAWVVSHLLTYGQWEDIWSWVDRDLVLRLFPRLDLPERLRVAWKRNLNLSTTTD